MKYFPGKNVICGNMKIPDNGVYLIYGPKFSGKLQHCNNFILNALKDSGFCIFVSSSFLDKKYKCVFLSDYKNLWENLRLLNLYTLDEFELTSTNMEKGFEFLSLKIKELVKLNSHRPVSFVLDSLTNFVENFGQEQVNKFITKLIFFLKQNEIDAIFTINSTSAESHVFLDKISHLFDGLLELKIAPESSTINRYIRLRSFLGNSNQTFEWIKFHVDNDHHITHSRDDTLLICNMCKEKIEEQPAFYLDLAFHKEHLNVYMRLMNFYGTSNTSEFGSSGILYGNFFFIDIVGLSDPSMSVKKQIEKIQILNNLISSCPAYKKDREKKILPTGDGMAIAFLNNLKLPVELSIELHTKLDKYNLQSNNESTIKARIGIGSGHVFLVNDLNDSQNLWGPGIIIARRVMDLGDHGHILLEGGIANNLFAIDHEYKKDIHYLGDHRIKHNQLIQVYSLYNNCVGNPQIPQKFLTAINT